VDSLSTDDTLKILAQYSQVSVFQRRFDTHGHQWNYGLQQVKTQWILSLDADYRLSDELITEIAQLSPKADVDAYRISFRYCVNGKPLRGAILPPRIALFRPDKATYRDDGHTQLLQVNGVIGTLTHRIYHDDRKPLNHWLWAQDRYAILEATKLLNSNGKDLSLADRLRQYKVVAPFLVLFYCLIIRGGILDGPAGWYYAWQRMLAEILLAIRLIEQTSHPIPEPQKSQVSQVPT
jgi:glycosyltransferase involved in cell wall biosynthesis